jgi:hypothetical protein
MTPEQMALLSEEAVRFIAEGQGALSRDGMRSLAAEVLVLRERTETWKRRVRRAVKGANARTAEQVRGALRNAVNRNALTTATARLAEMEASRDVWVKESDAARQLLAEASPATEESRAEGWRRFHRARDRADRAEAALAAKDARIAELESAAMESPALKEERREKDAAREAELARVTTVLVGAQQELRNLTRLWMDEGLAKVAREADVRALREALKAALAELEPMRPIRIPTERAIDVLAAALTRTAPQEAK